VVVRYDVRRLIALGHMTLTQVASPLRRRCVLCVHDRPQQPSSCGSTSAGDAGVEPNLNCPDSGPLRVSFELDRRAASTLAVVSRCISSGVPNVMISQRRLKPATTSTVAARRALDGQQFTNRMAYVRAPSLQSTQRQAACSAHLHPAGDPAITDLTALMIADRRTSSRPVHHRGFCQPVPPLSALVLSLIRATACVQRRRNPC
jgi:hypothetical protein